MTYNMDDEMIWAGAHAWEAERTMRRILEGLAEPEEGAVAVANAVLALAHVIAAAHGVEDFALAIEARAKNG